MVVVAAAVEVAAVVRVVATVKAGLASNRLFWALSLWCFSA